MAHSERRDVEDTALGQYFEAICKNGHTVDHQLVDIVHRIAVDQRSVFDEARPYQVDRFCRWCGASVITRCEQCGSGIPFSGGILVGAPPHPFCGTCGSPFPWASRSDRAGQLVALIEQEPLDAATRLAAEEAIRELSQAVTGDDAADEALVEDQVKAVSRLRRLAPHAWEFLQPVLGSVLTATAKERLGLP